MRDPIKAFSTIRRAVRYPYGGGGGSVPLTRPSVPLTYVRIVAERKFPEFCPEFRSEVSPNCLRSFRASFSGKRRPEKIHQKSPPFFNAKFPGKFEEKIHKSFLESGQSNTYRGDPFPLRVSFFFFSV